MPIVQSSSQVFPSRRTKSHQMLEHCAQTHLCHTYSVVGPIRRQYHADVPKQVDVNNGPGSYDDYVPFTDSASEYHVKPPPSTLPNELCAHRLRSCRAVPRSLGVDQFGIPRKGVQQINKMWGLIPVKSTAELVEPGRKASVKAG